MHPSSSDEAEIGKELCRRCGAVYHVVVRRQPTRAHDWYNCAICGELLMEWDSSDAPCFTLVVPQPNYPPRKPR